MAKCKICGREMTKANGCSATTLLLESKKYYARIRCKEEDVDRRTGRCGDCGAKPGYFHHWGCDLERCPKCGGQLISCECTRDMCLL